MKRRILSMVTSLALLLGIFSVSAVNVQAAENDPVKVDGSYLTMEDSSTGHSSSKTKGDFIMDGESTISHAGVKYIYAYASTTANQTVKYLCTIVYIDQYDEETKEWYQVDWWMEKKYNTYYMSTAKEIEVEPGYYYRVRSNHIAGDYYPYEEVDSVTDGIWV